MPVLLVPASYVEGKTRSIAAAEAEHGSTQDTLVETTMGEVRISSKFRPTSSPPGPAGVRWPPRTRRGRLHLALIRNAQLIHDPSLPLRELIARAQLLPLSFGPDDLAKPRPGFDMGLSESGTLAPASETDLDATAAA